MEPAQRATYPNLAIMALDMLSIPAMSDEPERLFSGARVTKVAPRGKFLQLWCQLNFSVGNNIILQYIALFGAYYISAILRIAISY
jgi:hypothetical protein